MLSRKRFPEPSLQESLEAAPEEVPKDACMAASGTQRLYLCCILDFLPSPFSPSFSQSESLGTHKGT